MNTSLKIALTTLSLISLNTHCALAETDASSIFTGLKKTAETAAFFGFATKTVVETETVDTFKAAYNMLGYKSFFHKNQAYGLNPDQIKQEQRDLPAVLFIHGNFHDDTAWVAAAKHLQKTNIPLFTVNLPAGDVGARDMDIVKKKWDEIVELYHKAGADTHQLKIHLVGHSRGAYVIQEYLAQKETTQHLGDVVVMGLWWLGTAQDADVFFDKYPSLEGRIFRLNGKNDVLLSSTCSGEYSYLLGSTPFILSENELRFDTGHVGLLYDTKVLAWMENWLK
mgnify:CR=1 FL=1